MDFKRLVIGMAVAMLLMMGWFQLVSYLHRTHPEWDYGNQQAATTEESSTTQPTTAPATMTAVTTSPAGTPVLTTQVEAPSTRVATAMAVIPAKEPKTTTIGSAAKDDPAAAMELSINPHGAGLNSVVLNEFKVRVGADDRYVYQVPYSGEGDDETRALSTRSITVDGQTFNLLKTDWAQVAATPTSTTYRTAIGRGSDEIVQIDKTYTLTPKSSDTNGPQGYEVSVTHVVTNKGGRDLGKVKIAMNGPLPPPVENDRMDDRQIVGAYNDGGHATLNHEMASSIAADTAPAKLDFSKYEGRDLVWVGTSGVYFNAIVRPDQSQPAKIETVKAVGLNFENPLFHHVIVKLETNEFAVPAGARVTQANQIFFGPKKRQLLKTDYYSSPLVNYDATLVMASGPCGYLTIQGLVNVLYYLLGVFHWIFRDWGLAIIGLVLVVRALLHPITKRAQVNMSKMGKMGPEIERLKKKYGDNKDELNKAMMQFYKQQGATPIFGCLPMFLQMPIWIALYSALQSTFELRQAPFLWGFTWIKDLAHPDRAIYFPNNPVNIWFIHFDAINILPIIMGVVSFMQAKIMQSQQPPATTPEQETQKKMMVWMSLLLPVFLYNGPSGLNLYIITSTSLGMWESHIVRKHIKEREAAEKAGVVIVDGPPKDDRPPTGGVRRKQPQPDKPSGGLGGWITRLQEKAEQMQKEQTRRGKKK
jgi:YidC/Oxa1 family membrane protein insertase